MIATPSIDQVKQVYVGKPDGCRCGCRGRYVYTETETPADWQGPADNAKVQRVLNKVAKYGGLEEVVDGILETVIGQSAYTIYLKTG
jgi:hypothetical protein